MIDIYPAIDLRDGKCVRLLQGDYNRQIDYSPDPVQVAQQFAAAGVSYLHVVDLDAARTGQTHNTATIMQIAKASNLKLQVGGGIRSRQSIEQLLDAGVFRVVIGTQALKDWQWFGQIVLSNRFAGRIALGLDARQGKLAVKGWTQQTEFTAEDIAAKVSNWPLAAIIYTDIARDGMLIGPNLAQTRLIAQATNVPVIASGGVSCLDDLLALAKLPIAGVIIGRALYENKFTLAEALKVINE